MSGRKNKYLAAAVCLSALTLAAPVFAVDRIYSGCYDAPNTDKSDLNITGYGSSGTDDWGVSIYGGAYYVRANNQTITGPFNNNTITVTATNWNANPAHNSTFIQAMGAAVFNDKTGTTVTGAFTNNSVVVNVIANTTGEASGGAIANFGGMTVGSGSLFTGNSAAFGGAIYNESQLTLDGNITFSGNKASGNPNDLHNKGTTNITGNGVVSMDGGITGTGTTNINGSSTLKFTGDATLDADQKINFASTNAKFENNTTGTFNLDTSQFTGNGGTIAQTGAGTLNIKGDAGNNRNFIQTDGSTHIDNNYNWTTTLNGGTMYVDDGITLSLTANKLTGAGGTLVNSGTINVNGNNSGYRGNFNQTNSTGTLNVNSTLFGGASSITGGEVNWNTSASKSSAAVLNIASTATLNVNGDLTLNNSADTVTLNNGDTWTGKVTVDNGTLTLDNFSSGNGTLVQNAGNLNLTNNSELTLGPGSIIQSAAAVNIASGNLIVDGGTLNINLEDNDVWTGEITFKDGIFNFDGIGSHGILNTYGGILNIGLNKDPVLNIAASQTVTSLVNLAANSTINIASGADVTFTEGSSWAGAVNNAGDFTLETANNFDGGVLTQTAGDFTLNNNSYFDYNISVDSITGGNVNVNSGSTFNILDDEVFGTGVNFNVNNGVIGTLSGALNTVTFNTLTIAENSTAGFAIDIKPRPLIKINDPADPFDGDKYAEADQFVFTNIVVGNGGAAFVQVQDFNLIGLAPTDRTIPVQLFDANMLNTLQNANITFIPPDKQELSPIGWYQLFEDTTPFIDPLTGHIVGDNRAGWYNLNLVRYNPQVFRGQVATMANYQNQLAINTMMFDRVLIPGQRLLADNDDNRYAVLPDAFDLSALQTKYTVERGGLWAKTYANIETLAMSQGPNINNSAYGTLVGGDFPVVSLTNGWKFMPTAFLGYSGGRQSYQGVSSYQNGGQLGFMGTFMKKNFTGSVMAYGGGYGSEMNVDGIPGFAGSTDKTGNWFAGVAGKAAYNFHPTKRFTLQPNVFVSYNAFGKQNWYTDFGVFSMNSGLLNGINAAPGVNFIYGRDTWSVYLTTFYMLNIMDGVGGKAGNVKLPALHMRHGYFEYGFGATKTFKDRFASYAQIVLRNAGRTGVGFQLGLSWKF